MEVSIDNKILRKENRRRRRRKRKREEEAYWVLALYNTRHCYSHIDKWILLVHQRRCTRNSSDGMQGLAGCTDQCSP
jgi:hypothetical protein